MSRNFGRKASPPFTPSQPAPGAATTTYSWPDLRQGLPCESTFSPKLTHKSVSLTRQYWLQAFAESGGKPDLAVYRRIIEKNFGAGTDWQVNCISYTNGSLNSEVTMLMVEEYHRQNSVLKGA